MGRSSLRNRCVLEDPKVSWPPVWRAVLNQLTVENATRCLPAGVKGSALRAAEQ